MTDKEYNSLIELTHVNGYFSPSNSNGVELASNLKDGEKIMVKNSTARDLKLHRCYFSLLNYVWLMLPDNFRAQVPCSEFYNFLKMLKGEYEVIFEFQDGRKMIEYKSISFGRMNDTKFKEYVKEQILVIYEDVIYKVFKDTEIAANIIENIENDYEKFFAKL